MIADDLTGATDTAAAFAVHGFATVVVLNRRARLPHAAEVIVLTTDSRHDSPRVARRKVRRACAWLRARGVRVLYKKMDSTLHGNIVAEVEAIRDAAGFACALVCPANPAQGRIVRRGVLFVRGKKAAELPAHFAAQGLRDATAVRSPVRAGEVSAAICSESRFVIADAVSRRDLARLARAALNAPASVLLAGSAGLAGTLAELLARKKAPSPPQSRRHLRGSTEAERVARRTIPAGPVLVLSGSRNPVTERQLEVLLRADRARLLALEDGGRPVIPTQPTGTESLIVRLPIHQRSETEIQCRLTGLNPLLRERRVSGLLLTGGDTALLVARWLRISSITIRGEIVPGLAWGHIVGGLADGLAVCTKPGGFGDERSIARAVAVFKGNAILRKHGAQPGGVSKAVPKQLEPRTRLETSVRRMRPRKIPCKQGDRGGTPLNAFVWQRRPRA